MQCRSSTLRRWAGCSYANLLQKFVTRSSKAKMRKLKLRGLAASATLLQASSVTASWQAELYLAIPLAQWAAPQLLEPVHGAGLGALLK